MGEGEYQKKLPILHEQRLTEQQVITARQIDKEVRKWLEYTPMVSCGIKCHSRKNDAFKFLECAGMASESKISHAFCVDKYTGSTTRVRIQLTQLYKINKRRSNEYESEW